MISSIVVSSTEVEDEVKGTQHDVPSARTFTSKQHHGSVKAEDLSERWHIGLSQAANTIKATTQRIVRSAIMPLAHQYRADRMFERPRIRGTIYTDTMAGRCQSLDGNKYAQIFGNESFFTACYPMESKSQAGEALKQFIEDFGIPDKIVCDGSGEQTGKKTEFRRLVRKHGIDLHVTEPGRHNQSKAEGTIREARKRWFRTMMIKRVPRRLWDYGFKWVCESMQRTASSSGSLAGQTPLEEFTGETPDISEYLDFGFYDWVWLKENAGLGETELGRWLGVSHRVGSLMSYWVLKSNGNVLSRTTVSRVTNLEMQVDDVKKRCDEFDANIKDRLQDPYVLDEGGKVSPQDWTDHPFEDN